MLSTSSRLVATSLCQSVAIYHRYIDALESIIQCGEDAIAPPAYSNKLQACMNFEIGIRIPCHGAQLSKNLTRHNSLSLWKQSSSMQGFYVPTWSTRVHYCRQSYSNQRNARSQSLQLVSEWRRGTTTAVHEHMPPRARGSKSLNCRKRSAFSPTELSGLSVVEGRVSLQIGWPKTTVIVSIE